jgi:membrane protease YdiL (CAAX protease family)
MSMPWVFAGFVLIWLVLDRSAAFFHSTYGEAGLGICALVLAAAVVVEMLVSRTSPGEAIRALGIGRPSARAVVIGLLLCLALLLFYPVLSWVTGTPLRLRGNWLWLIPGLFAQGGIAEETVFRGYMFRHLRARHSFWAAAGRATLPFTAVHLLLFFTQSPAVAVAATLLAITVSFPMAYLFELGRNTIWIPALLHFLIQGYIKLVELPPSLLMPAAVAWMGVCATVPYLVFLSPLSPRKRAHRDLASSRETG